MIALFPLRVVQIVDVSFQLLRKKFIKSFVVALCVTIPFQALVWLLAASQPSDTGLSGRIVLLIVIAQFLAIGASLTLTSNILSRTTSEQYCSTIFENIFSAHSSPSQIYVGIYQVGIQCGFASLLIFSRFFLGQVLTGNEADVLTGFLLAFTLFPWIFVTLRMGFAVPIAVNEGGTMSQVRKRTRQINRIHFWRLFGVYCMTVFMTLLITVPTLLLLNFVIASNFITSSIGETTMTNLVFALIIASVSAVYGYILTVTYFNARIEKEGLDISVAITQLESEEQRGKLFNAVSR